MIFMFHRHKLSNIAFVLVILLKEKCDPKRIERYFAITKIDKINFESTEKTKQRINFDNLTPLYPDEKLKMEVENPMAKDITHRVMDLIAPLGKGQRALIVAPPRTGKTAMLQNIAHQLLQIIQKYIS